MSIGSLKTLLLMLQDAPSMQGVSVLFGEENINAEDALLGMVVVVPVGGPYSSPGFGFSGANANIEAIWQTDEQIDLVIWSSVDPNLDPPPTAIDHADAVEQLIGRVLNALQFQQLPGGLVYRAVNGRWMRMGDGSNRYGRAYTLSVVVVKSIPADLYPEVVVRRTTVTGTIEEN